MTRVWLKHWPHIDNYFNSEDKSTHQSLRSQQSRLNDLSLARGNQNYMQVLEMFADSERRNSDKLRVTARQRSSLEPGVGNKHDWGSFIKPVTVAFSGVLQRDCEQITSVIFTTVKWNTDIFHHTVDLIWNPLIPSSRYVYFFPSYRHFKKEIIRWCCQ